MSQSFLPEIDSKKLKEVQESGDNHAYFELLCQPLHEELYKRQDFNFLDELTEPQQMLITYDYIQNQVLQGGFIQFIQNRYIILLPPMPAWLTTIGQEDMAQVIDDALKHYVLNRDILDKDTSVEEFAELYSQVTDFEPIDKRFEAFHEQTVKAMLDYATYHIEEFATIV